VRETSCGDCAARGTCGTEALGKVLGRRNVRLQLPRAFEVAVGDRVVIGLAEEDLVRGAGLVYLLPLLAMFGGGLLAELMTRLTGLDSELLVVAAAVAGLLLGLGVARRRLQPDGCGRLAGARLLRPESNAARWIADADHPSPGVS
jgi:sigma-E factor negative regulatory protein RseC